MWIPESTRLSQIMEYVHILMQSPNKNYPGMYIHLYSVAVKTRARA